MARFVVRPQRASGAAPAALAGVLADPEMRIVDQVGARLALVDVPDDALPRLRRLLPGWSIEPEGDVPLQ